MFRIAAPLVLLALAMQAVLGTEPDAFVWAAASAAVVLVTLAYCFRPNLLQRFPLSTLVVIGFDAVTLAIPLLAQAVCGRSFLYNLATPDQTFLWIYLTHAVLLGTHAAYTSVPFLSQPGRLLARRVFAPLTVFRSPSSTELWALGAVGLLATIYVMVSNVASIEYGDVEGKTIAGFAYFSVFPFLIPFRKLFSGGNGFNSLSSVPALVAYFGVILIVAMATNKRLTFSFIGLTLLVTMLLFSAIGRLRLSSSAKLKIAVVLIVSTPVFGFLENLTTAMEMVRGAKGSISGSGYISATVNQLGDEASIERYRKDNDAKEAGTFDYNDDYIPVALVNSIVFLKYTDTTMATSRYIGDSQRTVLKQDFVARLLNQLPTPVAQAFGIQTDKSLMEYSSGDIYETFANGAEINAGALTGSSITYARDVLGSFWMPGMVVVYLLIFNAFDALVLNVRGQLIIAPCAILFVFNLFVHGAIDDNLATLIGAATRGVLQDVALYLVVVSAIRVALLLLKPSGGSVGTWRARTR